MSSRNLSEPQGRTRERRIDLTSRQSRRHGLASQAPRLQCRGGSRGEQIIPGRRRIDSIRRRRPLRWDRAPRARPRAGSKNSAAGPERLTPDRRPRGHDPRAGRSGTGSVSLRQAWAIPAAPFTIHRPNTVPFSTATPRKNSATGILRRPSICTSPAISSAPSPHCTTKRGPASTTAPGGAPVPGRGWT